MNFPLAELWSAERAAAADQYTVQALGMPSAVLMERASLGVARVAIELLGGVGGSALVLVGPGNNGGDGLAAARILNGWGIAVQAWLVSERRNPAAEEQLLLCRHAGVPVFEGVPPPECQADLVVDALLGTGARGAPRDAVFDAIVWANAARGAKLAIDIPSGIDVDCGAVPTEAFAAHKTVTFVRSKPGLHITPARERAGKVIVADIGIVSATVRASACALIEPRWVADRLRLRQHAQHKGERGHVGVVVGGPSTAGAAVLAGIAALRGGAGLATLIGRDPQIVQAILTARPELMSAEPHGPQWLEAADALVVGPGTTSAVDGFAQLFTDDPRPSVWDAGALDQIPQSIPLGARVLTPHPGEAARMLARLERDPAWTSAAVQNQRLTAATRLAAAMRSTVVLKGAGTIVADDNGRVAIAVAGGSELATAGTGDCLAGLIGSFLAGGLSAWEAARVGVHVHAVAGTLAAQRFPRATASDVAEAIGRVTPALAEKVAPFWPTSVRG